MSESKGPPAWAIKLARAFVERARNLYGYSPERKKTPIAIDRAAMDYFVGAVVALREAGDEARSNYLGRLVTFLISTRGMHYVNELAANVLEDEQ